MLHRSCNRFRSEAVGADDRVSHIRTVTLSWTTGVEGATVFSSGLAVITFLVFYLTRFFPCCTPSLAPECHWGWCSYWSLYEASWMKQLLVVSVEPQKWKLIDLSSRVQTDGTFHNHCRLSISVTVRSSCHPLRHSPAVSERELDGACVQATAGHFAEKVDPSLLFAKQVGNMYTASVYSCLVSLLMK